MVDKVTGRSRGFGFVTMQDHAMLAKIMQERPHTLDGKEIDCKEAVPKESSSPAEIKKDFKTKKIFVGGLPHDLNEGISVSR
jgi:RNA recognition motif-containing protein